MADANDTLRISASLRQSWDDNYNRSSDARPEEITIAAAGLAFNKKISQQQLSANLGVSRYEHNRRDFLDATTGQNSSARIFLRLTIVRPVSVLFPAIIGGFRRAFAATHWNTPIQAS